MIAKPVKNLLALLLTGLVCVSVSAAPAGKKFSTPEKAVDAFMTAVRNYELATLVSIFGPGSEKVFQTEDAVADQKLRSQFLAAYDAKHTISEGANGSRVLVVGDQAWPFPVPLVKVGRSWAFDTAAGQDEIINRRIGRNELGAIQTCLAIADAQRDYYSRDRDGNGILEYAKKFRSTVGLKDGLFWPPSADEPRSPLGSLVAQASDDGYTNASSSYQGYHYKLLSGQGPNAEGGAYDYLANNHQIGGFAVLAYPAVYGESGIMTFMVSHTGVVYQRDFGADTDAVASKVTTFDPGEGWSEVSAKDLVPID